MTVRMPIFDRLLRATLGAALVLTLSVTQVFAQAALLPNAKQTFLDNNGKPLSSGKVYSYVPSTTTFKTTWSNSAQSANNTNPVTLDSAGRAVIYGQGSYQQKVTDSLGNVIWNAPTAAYGASAPSGSTGTDTAPVGTVMPYAGFTIPTNWQLAYGQALSRTGFPELKTAITITNTATSCSSGSTTLSGLADTTIIAVGSHIEATCIPTGVTVSSISSATAIVVSSAAVSTTVVTSVIYPWGNGDGVSTFNVPDLRGRTIAGADAMGGTAASRLTSTFYGASAGPPAVAGGSQSKVLLTANLPASAPTGTVATSTSTTTNTTVNILDPGHAHTLNPNYAQISGTYAAGAVNSGALGGGSSTQANTTGITASAASTSTSTSTSTFTGAALGSATALSIIQPSLTLEYMIKVTPNTTGAGGVVSINGMFGDIVCDASFVCAPVGTVNTIGCAIALTTQIGCLKPDGTTITVNALTGEASAIAGIASQITVGTTTVTGGVSGNVLYNNAGILGGKSTTGTGDAVLATSPTILGHPTVEGVTATGATGTGKFVFDTSPSVSNLTVTGAFNATGLVTNLDLANSSVAVNGTTCTLGSTCTPTAVASSIVIGTTVVTGGTTTRVLFNNAGTINEYSIIGGGSVCMTTNCVMTTPTLGAALATSINGNTFTTGTYTLTGVAAKTLTFNKSLTLDGTDGTTQTFPTTSATIARTDAAQTFTGVQTFSTPIALTSGGSGQGTALAARSSSGFNIDQATSTGDADYSIQATDRMVYHTALSVARTDTLPAANAVNAGQQFVINDFRGVADGTKTITLQRAGSDTINGGNTVVAINAQYGAGIFWSDGSSRWTFQPTSSGGGSGTVTQVACAGLTITVSGTCPDAFSIFNCSLATSVAANILTVALKDSAGNDPSATSPCTVGFRSATATTGTVSFVSRTSALSITTNATGATLGSVNAVAFRFWVAMFNDAGTPVLALYNASTFTVLTAAEICSPDETQVATTVPISGSATSACVYYSPNGTTVTAKAFRILGYIEYDSAGLTTAGTYASGPDFIQNTHPGMKRPGDIVKCKRVGNVAGSTVTSSTFATSNATLSLTPTSAANLVQVDAWGALYTAISVNSAQARLQRGSTAITGNTRLYTTTGAESLSPYSQSVIDKPNSASATTYAVYLASSNNTNATGFLDSGASIKACEVMG